METPKLNNITRKSYALGCEISMTVLHEDESTANAALDDAFAEVARVEKVMSIYSPESDLAQLNRDGYIKNPDPYLVRALEESREMSERSEGAFDVTVQPLWTLYASAQKAGRLPTDEELKAAKDKVGWRRVSIGSDEIRLMDEGMAVTLNGIAQGFAADRATEALRRHGITRALIDTGELSSLGTKADGQPWLVGIQHPRQKDAYIGIVKLDGQCMTTSGDYETRFTDDFVYNHIFEPRTGRSPVALSSVTVIAPTATLADCLSTAVFVLGPEKGLALAKAYNGVDILLVMKEGTTLATEDFPFAQ